MKTINEIFDSIEILDETINKLKERINWIEHIGGMEKREEKIKVKIIALECHRKLLAVGYEDIKLICNNTL